MIGRLSPALLAVLVLLFAWAAAPISARAFSSSGQDQSLVGGAGACKVTAFVVDPQTGVCGCPSGEAEVDSSSGATCVNPCPSGQQIGSAGTCAPIPAAAPATSACPSGTALIGTQCVNPCPDGQEIGADAKCGPIASGQCPDGTTSVNGQCINPCPAGQQLGADGKCAATTATGAGSSAATTTTTTKTKAKTTRTSSKTTACAAGTIRQGGACVPVCPDGRPKPAGGTCSTGLNLNVIPFILPLFGAKP